MKKVFQSISKFVAAAFSLAVLGLLMSLTYGALQFIFPDNFANQIWGLIMFDIAAMCWALIFVFQSHSTGQYAAAAIGFVVAFLGTLLMVGAEVILSGQSLAQIDTGELGRWMVYGFIIVTALHAALVYSHHALAPEIAEQINVGVARGEVVSQAIADAAKSIEAEKHELSQAIYNDIVSQVKRDLGMFPVSGTPFERKQAETAPLPVTWARQEDAKTAERPLSLRFRDWVSSLGRQSTPQSLEQIAQTSDALCAWQETASGRRRLWCKVCRDDGLPWLTDEPCSHISTVKDSQHITAEVAQATLRALMREPAKSEPSQ